MKKIGSVVYHKLMLQADEADFQGLEKLASDIREAVGQEFDDTLEIYSQDEMNQDIHQGLWKLATCILKRYNCQSADAEKLNDAIESLASSFIERVESAISVDIENTNDPILPGEVK